MEKLKVCLYKKIRCDEKVKSLKKKLESKQGLSNSSPWQAGGLC